MGYTRAARTDKGVSAACQVITLNCTEGLCTQKVKDKGGNESTVAPEETLTYLNTMVPSEDIRVLHVTQCDHDFDARRHCERRIYEYLMPLSAFQCPDGSAMEVGPLRKSLKRVLAKFRGTHCWRNFTRKSNPVLADNQLQRHVFRASVGEVVSATDADGVTSSFLCISLSGEGFLYHMCRKIAGLAYAVAAGLVPEEAIDEALKGSEEHGQRIVPTAPGHLLYLAECSYSKYECKHHVSFHQAETCRTMMGDWRKKIQEHVIGLDRTASIFEKWAADELAVWCKAWHNKTQIDEQGVQNAEAQFEGSDADD
jgi:tRNA pseudouridine38-40 synthase